MLDNILLAARPATLCQSSCFCVFCVIVTNTLVLATPTKTTSSDTTTAPQYSEVNHLPDTLTDSYDLGNDSDGDYDDVHLSPLSSDNMEAGELRLSIALLDILGTFIVAGLAVFIPYFFENVNCFKKNSQRLISIINCIGAGILLGTCFFHYMPEVRHEFEKVELFCGTPLEEIQLEIFSVAGFLLILLIEQFITTYIQRFMEEGGFPTHCHNHGQQHHTHTAGHSARNGLKHNHPEHEVLIGANTTSPSKSEASNNSNTTKLSADAVMPNGDGGHTCRHNPADAEAENSPHDDHCHEDILQHSALRSLAFVGSLGIHSVVEGFSLVLLQTKIADPDEALAKNWALLVSICIHKFAVGLTMGFTLKSSKLSRFNSQIALLSFALFTPIGGVAAYFAGDSLPDLIIAPLNAIGLGTFFYVLFFEIAPHEFLGSGENRNKFVKALIVVAGAGLALLLASTLSHSHGPDDHHPHHHDHDH